MKTIRFLLATVVSALGVFAVVEACGGQLTIGYDDAGNYHTPDGSVLVYGSLCSEWDASHLGVEGGTTCQLDADLCNAWFQPPQWPLNFECLPNPILDDAGQQVVPDGGPPLVTTDIGHCEVVGGGVTASCSESDPTSAAYCTAYFEQYVTHGHVAGFCVGQNCGFHAVTGCIEQTGIEVTDDDGGITCSPPCTP